MHLEAGDILTCDGIVIDMAHDIKVDESDATGESDAVAKASLAEALEEGEDSGEDEDGQGSSDNDSEDPKKKKKKTTKKRSDPFLLSGSKVLEGKGHYVVVAVGTNSFQGKIFMSLRASQPNQTKMQKSLNNLAEKIAKIASFFGALLFVCLFIRNCIELKTKPDRTPAQKGQGFIQSFVIAVTLIVVAVPEGERRSQHQAFIHSIHRRQSASELTVFIGHLLFRSHQVYRWLSLWPSPLPQTG